MSAHAIQRISQQQLESYLWGAATLLRGTIDAGDYKQFIFPLLFYKRLCDVFDEERAKAIEELGEDFPENHRFKIPMEAHWSKTRELTTNVGQAIQSSMRAIEKANQDKLYGIFGDAQWTNKDRLSDAMLRDLIEHFSRLDLTIENLPEDELGNGYEYLIKKFADDSGHTAAEFYTNRTVVHLMTELLQPQPGESIYDPTCGSGGMLLSAIAYLRNQGKEWRNVKLHGQELNLMTSSIARMNCFLHGIEDFRIERGNTLSNPKFIEGGELQKFDVILANPPYSIKQWDRATFENDPWGRNQYGTPPQSCADYAFQQHINKSLDPGSGRCAILWPHGILFRRAEREIRRKMIEDDLIECVIGLGKNLFYNSAMEACILICRTDKPAERRGKILLIDALDEVTHERGQSFLTDSHIARITQAYHGFSDEPRFAKVITKEEALGHDGSLALPLYVESGDGPRTAEETLLQLGESLAGWSDASKQLRDVLAEVLPDVASEFPELGEVQEPNWLDRSSWKRVKLGDVVVRTAKKVDIDPDKVQRWVGADHMDEGDIHIRRWSTTDNSLFPPTFRYTFQAGTVMFHSRNPKKVCMPQFEGITGEKIFVMRAKDEKELSTRYLGWYLSSPQFQERVRVRLAGSVNRFLNWTALASLEIQFPPMRHQKLAMAILETVDASSEGSSRLAFASQCAIRAMLAHHMPRCLDLDRPDICTTLESLCDEVITYGIVQAGPDSVGGIPYIRVSDMTAGPLSEEGLLRTTPEIAARYKRSEVREGELICALRGQPGLLREVPPPLDGANLTQGTARISLRDPSLKTYLRWVFQSPCLERQMLITAKGSTFAELTLGALRSLKVPLLDKQDRKAFSEALSNLDCLKQTAEIASENSKLVLERTQEALL